MSKRNPIEGNDNQMKCECGNELQVYAHQLYCSVCNKWSLKNGTGKQPEEKAGFINGYDSSCKQPEDYTKTEYKNVTLIEPKPESNSDEIREAFEKEDIPVDLNLWLIGEDEHIKKLHMQQLLFIGFKSGYKSEFAKYQAEIEEFKDMFDNMTSDIQRFIEEYAGDDLTGALVYWLNKYHRE